MRWQKDGRTSFEHLPPIFCRLGVSGGAFHLIHRKRSPFPSRGRLRTFHLIRHGTAVTPSPQGEGKSPSPARKQKISSLCSEIFGKNPSNAKRSPLRYGSWSPVGTVQDRPRRQSRTALDTCHRHTAPPFLRKVPGFFRLERSESSFCQRVGAQSSWPRFLRKKAEKRFWKGDGLIYE